VATTTGNRLFYGDNLDVLRQHVPASTVDLVYLDPPFNSARNYNVIFNRHDITADAGRAQIQAFADTWHWTPVTDEQYARYVGGDLPGRVADALTAFRTLLGENDAMAYLVNMAPRLVEMHRVLRPTGSLYLHCDPTMSHYLKVMLDAIFGAENFINDISWQRSSNRSSISRVYRRAHDCLLFYAKSDKYRFDIQFKELSAASKANYSRSDERGHYRAVPLLVSGKRNGDTGQPWRGIDPNTRGKEGMHWVTTRKTLDEYEADGRVLWPTKKGSVPYLRYYADESPGVPLNDMWDDISLISPSSAEALGYPTQKPVALLERILLASSNEGDTVLDPFCGCGTSIDAAIRTKRKWLGIDITYIAIDLIEKRLRHVYGNEIAGSYEVLGIPRDKAAALALFSRSPFDFERWAVSLLNGQPNEKQVGDKGVDGVARFPIDARGNVGRVLISVKGGRQLNPSMVRDLGGTVVTQKAEMGVLVTNGPPTRGMTDEANHAGSYAHPNYPPFPRIQIVTVDQLLSGVKPKMPPTLTPYIQALRAKTPADQGSLFDSDSN